MSNDNAKIRFADADKNRIINIFNNTEACYPADKTIHQLFEEYAEKNPHDTAVIFKEHRLTYGQLNIKASQLAEHLVRKKGVSRGEIIGIMVERSLEMIIGILGILKAGGAYMPISPETPIKRIEYMLSDSEARLLLTQKKFLGRVHSEVEEVNLDDESIYTGSEGNLSNIYDSKSLIYVIYTSGSTGKPKGVMVEHHSVVNRLNWMQKAYPLQANDVILQKTPFVFDVSVWELFWWATTGASMCFIPPGMEKFPQAIIETIERNNITTIHFVPSMLNSFLNYIEDSDEVKRITSLKRVFASGEALTAPHVRKFNKVIYKETGARLINLYGPTEATVDVTYYDCPVDENINKVPIGKPIDNIKMFIINNNEIQPIGVEGELCISGVGLARGYLNRPELTMEKFVDNPVLPGERMYRTGDLAIFLEDGNIEFIGRMDHQVKIRGLRIELGEIEAIITEYNAVNQCVVVIKDISSVNPMMTAYIVPRFKFAIQDLKRYLKEQLPDYMIPNQYVMMQKLPSTQSGKIDRNMLMRM